jgi:hypothetical protein
MTNEWPDSGLRMAVKDTAVDGEWGMVDGVDEVPALDLEEEIALVRGAMREARLMMEEEELDALALYRVSRVVIQGAGVVATLLRTKRILARKEGDEMLGIMGIVLDELFDENGWVR